VVSVHRWVRHELAMDYIRLGWLPLPTLQETPHGQWSTHLAWLCPCPAPDPRTGIERLETTPAAAARAPDWIGPMDFAPNSQNAPLPAPRLFEGIWHNAQ
jgi:hypothetical protein